ncbi:MAG: TonB-dependent receptor, partial [Geminicoccaceae bacterium]|nr:TonB-dependent receptor [Geminicoccaceae bacterium]
MSEGATASARLASGFRMPQVHELYRLQRGQEVADIGPERLAGLELGWRRDWEGAGLALELFAYRKRDLVLRDAAGFLVSGGRTRHFGAELSFAHALGSGFALAGQLSLARHRYAFTRELAGGERIVAGRRIDSAPRRLAALALGRRFADGAEARLQLRHLGPYPTDAENLHVYPGHTLIDAELILPLGEDLVASLRIANLADLPHAERADFAF